MSKHQQRIFQPAKKPVPPDSPPKLLAHQHVSERLCHLNSDPAIQNLMSQLERSIRSHVASFYGNVRHVVIEPPAMERATIGLHVSWLPLEKLLCEPKTRADAITLCISWTLLSRCLLLKDGVRNNLDTSLLPPELVDCFRSMSFVQSEGQPAFLPSKSILQYSLA